MAKHAFDKFMNSAPQGAKKKEMAKVEKRRAKADSKAVGDQTRREKYEKQHGIVSEEKPPARKGSTKPENKFQDGKQPEGKFQENKKSDNKFKEGKQQEGKFQESKKSDNKFKEGKQQEGKFQETKKSDNKYKEGKQQEGKFQESKLQDDKTQEKKSSADKKPAKAFIRSNSDKYYKEEAEAPTARTKTVNPKAPNASAEPAAEEMPLNKFIAHAGVCGRREAAELVKQRLVSVNGDIVYEPGYKVSARDEIKVKGKQIFPKKNLVYILLNKPKDFITTSSDPDGRKTVLDLLKGATPERIYPVGRLDRNTTGVLLLTNDGELAQQLTHPSFQIKKVYAVKLDKPLTKRDFDSIVNGINLEDGEAHADSLAYSDTGDKSLVGIEIHNGRNRIVRRIFEHLGYEIKTLDRVMFANLTKKNVERSRWRFLNEKEIRSLKFMNQSFVRKTVVKEVPQDLPE